MLNSIDYNFGYKNISRFLIMHKFNFFNGSVIPELNKIILFFSLKDMMTLDDARIYNYFYFFKFFLGVTAFFLVINHFLIVVKLLLMLK